MSTDRTEVFVPLLVRMPPDMHEALAERSEQEDRSMAAITRRALRDYLKKVPR